VPTLAALRHPQPASFVRTGPALVVAGGSTRHRHDVDVTGTGVDAAHGQGSSADTVLFGQDVDHVGAKGQRGALSAGQLADIDAGVTAYVHRRGREVRLLLQHGKELYGKNRLESLEAINLLEVIE
jgi:hypothetical protein